MPIKKNTRGRKQSAPLTDMAGIRKSPRNKTRATVAASSGETTPSKKPKKEPAKRGRKKKSPDEGSLLLGNKISKNGKDTRSHSAILDPAVTPLLTPDSARGGLAILGRANTTTVNEEEILAATDPQKLRKLIERLVSTEQDVIFDRYRQTSRLQMNSDSKKIAALEDEVKRQQATIVSLQGRLLSIGDSDGAAINSTPRKKDTPELYESPIRRQTTSSSLMIHQEDLANELKTIGITLDMLELLTGVRMINYEEDREKFYFDVKQTSTNMDNDADAVSIVYRLVIKKQFEQTAEVTYEPSFLKGDMDDSALRVSKHLPEYFQDNLIFPYNTLLQFYTKMSKALNKSAKAWMHTIYNDTISLPSSTVTCNCFITCFLSLCDSLAISLTTL